MVDTAPAPEVDEDDWSAQLDALEKRPPLEDFITLHDPDKLHAVGKARRDLLAARRKVAAGIKDDTLTDAQVRTKVNAHKDVKAAQKVLDEADAAESAAQVTFHFRALPPHLYEGLKGQHPPTDAQAEDDLAWNPQTYIPALWSACSVKPLPVERAAKLLETLNTGDASALAECCRSVNETSTASLGKGSRATTSSDGS